MEPETPAPGAPLPEVSAGVGVWEEVLGFPQEPALTARLLGAMFPQSLMGAKDMLGGAVAAPGGLGGWPSVQTSAKVSNRVDSCCFLLCSQYALISARLFPGPLFLQGSEVPSGAPVLTLRFSYICPDRHLRRYVVLEPDAQAAVQVMGPRRLVGERQVRPGVHLLIAASSCRSCSLC